MSGQLFGKTLHTPSVACQLQLLSNFTVVFNLRHVMPDETHKLSEDGNLDINKAALPATMIIHR